MSRQQWPRGFTLVELLVVFGILLVLMAILLPALSKAREQSRSVKCASNERQIFLAVSVYATENKGWLPVPPMYTWGNAPLPYYFKDPNLGFLMSGPGAYDFERGMFWPALGGSAKSREELFACPTDLAGPRLVRNFPGLTRNFTYNFNYSLRADILNKRDLGGIRFTDIRHSERKIIVFEEERPADGVFWWTTPYPPENPQLSVRHSGMANQCFADGHVERFQSIKFGTDSDNALLIYYCDFFGDKW